MRVNYSADKYNTLDQAVVIMELVRKNGLSKASVARLPAANIRVMWLTVMLRAAADKVTWDAINFNYREPPVSCWKFALDSALRACRHYARCAPRGTKDVHADLVCNGINPLYEFPVEQHKKV